MYTVFAHKNISICTSKYLYTICVFGRVYTHLHMCMFVCILWTFHCTETLVCPAAGDNKPGRGREDLRGGTVLLWRTMASGAEAESGLIISPGGYCSKWEPSSHSAPLRQTACGLWCFEGCLTWGEVQGGHVSLHPWAECRSLGHRLEAAQRLLGLVRRDWWETLAAFPWQLFHSINISAHSTGHLRFTRVSYDWREAHKLCPIKMRHFHLMWTSHLTAGGHGTQLLLHLGRKNPWNVTLHIETMGKLGMWQRQRSGERGAFSPWWCLTTASRREARSECCRCSPFWPRCRRLETESWRTESETPVDWDQCPSWGCLMG